MAMYTIQDCGRAVDAVSGELIALSQFIHAHPETKWEEVQASAALTRFFTDHGFAVQSGYAGMHTAFRAEYDSAKPGAVIAFVCEYDALPEIGHGCGHNVIAAASAGAAVALMDAVHERGGKIVVLGTPAEEGGGGAKPVLCDGGYLDDIDCAMMLHPGAVSYAGTTSMAASLFEFVFHGRAAHAGAEPEKGANALDAAVQTYCAINNMRSVMQPGVGINMIITEGGTHVGTIPAVSKIIMGARAAETRILQPALDKIMAAVPAIAQAAGCTADIVPLGNGYKSMLNNPTLCKLYAAALTSLGELTSADVANGHAMVTDMGNISQIMPALHGTLSIGGSDLTPHTTVFRDAAKSEFAMEMMLKGAKALAATALNLIEQPRLLEQAKEEFQKMRGV